MVFNCSNPCSVDISLSDTFLSVRMIRVASKSARGSEVVLAQKEESNILINVTWIARTDLAVHVVTMFILSFMVRAATR